MTERVGAKFKQKGFFITFEGPEGSGKSTQANLLYHFLKRKWNCIYTREPGGTKVGEAVRKILLNPCLSGMDAVCELFLFEASRAQLVREIILPALAKGKIVICDRFTDATTAYQGYGEKISMDFIAYINKFATCSLTPDLTILMDINSKAGLKKARLRKQKQLDRIEKKHLRVHNLIRKGYLEIAKQNPERIKVFNSKVSIQDNQRNIRNFVESKLIKH